MTQSACTKDQFLSDVALHTMSVLRDDGVNRHIRFKMPEGHAYWFDLITWSGTLCIDGDMGTYVFRRIEDMFNFFRTDRAHQNLGINPCYWSEKVRALSKHGGIKEFDEALFEKEVIRHLASWIREHRYATTKEERRDLWDAVVDQVIRADDDSSGGRKQIAFCDFHHQVTDGVDFVFDVFAAESFKSYTFDYLWCCYAIAWGIQTYDNAKTGGAA